MFEDGKEAYTPEKTKELVVEKVEIKPYMRRKKGGRRKCVPVRGYERRQQK